MTLSQHEQEILRSLESQLASSAGGPRRFQYWHLRLGPWADRLGWLMLATGFVSVLALLPTSVGASFVAFLVAVTGLGLVATGRTGLRAHDYAARRRSRAPGRSSS